MVMYMSWMKWGEGRLLRRILLLLLLTQLSRLPQLFFNKTLDRSTVNVHAQVQEGATSLPLHPTREEEGRAIAGKLKQGSQSPRPPVVFIPGLVASRMIAWKQKTCKGPGIDIQDVVWLNLQKLMETLTYDKHCWLDCMKLDKNQSDPIDCKIRPDLGLHAVGEMAPGNIYTPPSTSVFTPLIRFFAKEMSYDSNSLHGAPYDWRLSPQELESRDSYFTNLRHTIESAVQRHQLPVIIVAHSMGNNLFLYFCDWMKQQFHLKTKEEKAGDQTSTEQSNEAEYHRWMQQHIWAHVGYAAPLLGAPAALKSVMSGHTFGLPISPLQARDLMLGFPSTHYLNPRSSRSTQQSEETEAADYDEVLVSIRKGEEHVANYSIHSVDEGYFFQEVAALFHDIRLEEKYAALRNYFDKDVLQPLRKKYTRPPIPHVVMVYGVDLPTEVSYLYRIPDDNKATNNQSNDAEVATATTAPPNTFPSEPMTPILEEVYFEESFGEHVLQEMRIRQEKGIFPLSSLSNYFSFNPQQTSSSANQAGTDSISSQPAKSNPNSNGKKIVAWYQQLVKHAFQVFQANSSSSNTTITTTTSTGKVEFDQFGYPICLSEEEHFSTISNNGTLLSTSSCSAQMLFSYESPKAYSIHIDGTQERFKEDKKLLTSEEEKILAENVYTDPITNTDTSQDKDFEEVPRRLSNEHKAEVYGIRTKEYFQPTKKQVKYHSKHIHSGDNTVPYVSLSYAKVWLNQTKYFVDFLLTANRPLELLRNDSDKEMLDNNPTEHSERAASPLLTTTASVSTRLNLLQTAWTKSVPDSQRTSTKTPVVTTRRASSMASNQEDAYYTSEKAWSEYRPARMHTAKHVLDNWKKHKKVLDPAVELHYQETALFKTDTTEDEEAIFTATTTIVEVSGVDHLDISKNAYVYNLVFYELLLPKLHHDFCLDGMDASNNCQSYSQRVGSK